MANNISNELNIPDEVLLKYKELQIIKERWERNAARGLNGRERIQMEEEIEEVEEEYRNLIRFHIALKNKTPVKKPENEIVNEFKKLNRNFKEYANKSNNKYVENSQVEIEKTLSALMKDVLVEKYITKNKKTEYRLTATTKVPEIMTALKVKKLAGIINVPDEENIPRFIKAYLKDNDGRSLSDAVNTEISRNKNKRKQ